MAEQLNLEVPKIASDPSAEQPSSLFLSINRSEVLRVGIFGAIVGVLIPLLAFLAEKFIIEPAFCSSANTFQICASGGLVAHGIATGFLGILSVVLFVNWQIFRPLVVVVAALTALWGVKGLMGNVSIANFGEYVALSALLYGLAYILFFWTMRLRSFMASLIVTAALVVGFRWFLML